MLSGITPRRALDSCGVGGGLALAMARSASWPAFVDRFVSGRRGRAPAGVPGCWESVGRSAGVCSWERVQRRALAGCSGGAAGGVGAGPCMGGFGGVCPPMFARPPRFHSA